MKKPIKIGDIVHCTFLDHAENSKDAIEFEVLGRVTEITKTAYKLVSWGYTSDTDRARDNNDDNEVWFCIVKKAVTGMRLLK